MKQNTKKENLGFMLLHIDSGVAENILKPISCLSKKINKNCIIFNSYNISTYYELPIMHVSQSKFFTGNIIAFDIMGLLIATACYKTNYIYYYAKDIPWLSDSSTDFSFWSNLFEDDRVKIISENKDIAYIFEKTWKKPIAITNDLCSDEVINNV